MNENVQIVKTAVEALEVKLGEEISKHTAEVQAYGKASTELTKSVDELSVKYTEMKAKLDAAIEKYEGSFAGGMPQAKSLGAIVLDSPEIKAFMNGQSNNARVEIKNTIIGEGGSPQNPIDTIVAPDRRAGIVPGAFRALNVLDIVPFGVTSSNQVHYTQELLFTNAAAERAEGTAKPETDLTFKLVEEPVRTIAHFIKLSKQVLADAPALEGYVNNRMVHGLQRRLQFQILRGNGTSPNIAGLTATGRNTAFTPATGDTALDSINRAKYAVIGADFSPNVVLINPADWSLIERSKVSGGGYVLGDGGAVGYVQNGMVQTVWGLTVVASNDVESGKFYVLDTNAIEFYVRESINVEFGFINDDFTKNLMTLRAEMRGALAVYQPTAVRFGSLTV
jgi:HK97 family phage major capsid protein